MIDMCLMNGGETNSKTFPYPTFEVHVQDKAGSRKCHFHVINKNKGFDVRIALNGELLSVKCYGSRERTNNFEDVAKRAKLWLDAVPSTPLASKIFKTNRDYTRYEFFRQNPDYKADKEQLELYERQIKELEACAGNRHQTK